MLTFALVVVNMSPTITWDLARIVIFDPRSQANLFVHGLSTATQIVAGVLAIVAVLLGPRPC